MLKASGWKGYTFPAFVVRVYFEYLLHHDGPEPELPWVHKSRCRACVCLRATRQLACDLLRSRTCSTH